MKRVFCGLALVACATPTDATSERTATSESGAVIGERDFVRVLQDGATVPAKYRPLLDAFGKLSRYCTVTHLGNGLALTAGHCFNASPTRTDNQPCAGFTVDWGYRRDRPAYLRSECQVVLAAEYNLTRDYALFVIDPIPPVKVNLDLVAQPTVGRRVTMFSHPLNRPLEWSKTCRVEPSSNLLEVGSPGTWGGDMFTHQCDTERGSSGAAILDDETLAVVGIHNGGIVPWNYATFVTDTPAAELLAPDFNVPPVVAFDSPAGTLRATTTFAVRASDPDGEIAKVVFHLPGGTTAELTAAPYSITFDTTTVADGGYTLMAVAIDARGAETRALRSIRIQNR